MEKTKPKMRKGLKRCFRPKDTGRRITTLFMSLVLVLALVAPMFPAMEVHAATEYGLWVGNVQVTSENKDDIPGVTGEGAKASYDPDTRTLTLENVTGLESYYYYWDEEATDYVESFCIYSEDDLTIVGEATIDCAGGAAIGVEFDDLTINGEFEFYNSSAKHIYSVINAYDIYVRGGNLSVSSENSISSTIGCRDLHILSGNVSVIAEYVAPNAAVEVRNKLTMTGGTLEVLTDDAHYPSITAATFGDSITPEEGRIDDSSGFVTVVDEDGEYAQHVFLYVKYDLWIGGTQVTSKNANSIPCDSGKASYDPETKTLTLDNAVFRETGESTYIIEAQNDLAIKGTGTLVNEEAKSAIMITRNAVLKLDADLDITAKMAGITALFGEMQIMGGDIKVKVSGDESFGIVASKLVISGGNTEIDSKQAGIYALKGIEVTGGTVNASGSAVAIAAIEDAGITIDSTLEITNPTGGEVAKVTIDGAVYNAIVDGEGNAAKVVVIEPIPIIIVTEYTVTYDANGKMAADMPAAQTVEEGEKATAPDKTPKADGFVFSGWYTSADCKDTEKYDFTAAVTENVTLYAKWTKEKVNVSGVTLDNAALELKVGSTGTLTATVTPKDASDKTVFWESGDTDVATVAADGKVTAVAAGTATITATATNGTEDTADDKTATCIVTVTTKKTTPEIPEEGPALVKDIFGKTIYYKDGEAQKDYSGLVNVDGIWYYVENGVLLETKTGFVMYEDGLFLVVEGKLETGKSGLVQDPYNPDIWYFLANGQVQTQYTGLALYDGEWFYVDKGRLDTTIAAYIEYDGGLFYVAAGRILKEVSGLAQDPNGPDWYFLAEGQAQTQYTGLALYDGEWFYVVYGKLAEDYTGTVEYDGAEFYVVSGMVK